ncbi:MAG: lysylphosphatidylglycerol synthase domain-containing protein [Patescibacteria group bacterium]
MLSKPWIKTGITLVVLTAILYFFITTLQKNWNEVSEIGFQFRVSFIAALCCFFLAVLVSGYLWGKIVTSLDNSKRIIHLEFIRVHIGSWLQKYIPGQVSSFLGKLLWGIERNYSKKMITTSFLYENVFLLYSSILISTPVLIYFSLDELAIYSWRFLIVFIFFLSTGVILHKNTFIKVLNGVLSVFKRKSIPAEFILEPSKIAFFVLMFTVPRLLNGIGFMIIVHALYTVSFETAVVSIATYIFAGVIGILAFFVPSGIGVREGIIVLLLTPYLGVSGAIIVSIYARFLTIITDILLALIYVVIGKIGKIEHND